MRKKLTVILTHLLLALRFLTVISVRSTVEITSKALARSMAWFPLVGLLIGLILGGIWYAMSFGWPGRWIYEGETT